MAHSWAAMDRWSLFWSRIREDTTKGNCEVLLDNRCVLREERAGISKQANPRAESTSGYGSYRVVLVLGELAGTPCRSSREQGFLIAHSSNPTPPHPSQGGVKGSKDGGGAANRRFLK